MTRYVTVCHSVLRYVAYARHPRRTRARRGDTATRWHGHASAALKAAKRRVHRRRSKLPTPMFTRRGARVAEVEDLQWRGEARSGDHPVDDVADVREVAARQRSGNGQASVRRRRSYDCSRCRRHCCCHLQRAAAAYYAPLPPSAHRCSSSQSSFRNAVIRLPARTACVKPK